MLSLALACDPEGGAVRGDAGSGRMRDSDGDTISDFDEGTGDTDNDGTPDHRDTDSDGDGIGDREEAGDADLATVPRDSDSDGLPDFQDQDSDGNGIFDGEEREGDVDGDTLPNRIDLDDDDDFLSDVDEIAGELVALRDSDADGTPNFQDTDSDNDFILDREEGAEDTDVDGEPDYTDTDSDNDGVPDEVEAGDLDVNTPAVDSDEDRIPDYRDADSDNDGLPDRIENTAGTNRRQEDTDGDGVSDLIEVSAGTDATDGTVNPRTRGDFVFLAPFGEAVEPVQDTLRFSTSIQFADIYFLFDESGTMAAELTALASAVTRIIDGDPLRPMDFPGLSCEDFETSCDRDSQCAEGQVCSPGGTCIEDPFDSACIASPWTGAGRYLAPVGATPTFTNTQSLQADPARTQDPGLDFETRGGTDQEYLFRAVLQLMGAAPGGARCAPEMAGRVGCVGFRSDAVKVLVIFTDEGDDGPETLEEAATALDDVGVRVLGVWSGARADPERNDLLGLVNQTRSVDAMGNPFIVDGIDEAIIDPLVQRINEAVEGVPVDVTVRAVNEEAGRDAVRFIQRLEANPMATARDGECAMLPVRDDDEDRVDDTYSSVAPGTPVCFDVFPRPNDFIEPTREPQVFIARIEVVGEGSPLDERFVYFLVPPVIPEPGTPM